MKKLGYLGLVFALVALAAPAAWAQRQGRGGGFGGGFGGFGLLAQKSVQTELKLTDEQVKQVNEKVEKQRASAGGLRDLSREERQTKLAEITKANDAAVATILKEDQAKRFKQISLQQRGAAALADPEVATALDLTSEQKGKLKDIQQSSQTAMREAFQAGGGGDRQAAMKKLQELRTANNDKALELLTPEQKEKWKSLTGEPFKGEITRPQFRGNRGAARQRRSSSRSALSLPVQTVFALASFVAPVEDGARAAAPSSDAAAPASEPAKIAVSDVGDSSALNANDKVLAQVAQAPGDERHGPPGSADRDRDSKEGPKDDAKGKGHGHRHRKHRGHAQKEGGPRPPHGPRPGASGSDRRPEPPRDGEARSEGRGWRGPGPGGPPRHFAGPGGPGGPHGPRFGGPRPGPGGPGFGGPAHAFGGPRGPHHGHHFASHRGHHGPHHGYHHGHHGRGPDFARHHRGHHGHHGEFARHHHGHHRGNFAHHRGHHHGGFAGYHYGHHHRGHGFHGHRHHGHHGYAQAHGRHEFHGRSHHRHGHHEFARHGHGGHHGHHAHHGHDRHEGHRLASRAGHHGDHGHHFAAWRHHPHGHHHDGHHHDGPPRDRHDD